MRGLVAVTLGLACAGRVAGFFAPAGAGEPSWDRLKTGDWVRYGREADGHGEADAAADATGAVRPDTVVRGDVGMFFRVLETDGTGLKLAIHFREAGDAAEAERLARAMGLRVFPELTEDQLAAFIDKAARDLDRLDEKDMEGLPPAWVRERLDGLANIPDIRTDAGREAAAASLRRRLPGMLANRRADTLFRFGYMTTEQNLEATVGKDGRFPLALLPAAYRVDAGAEAVEDAAAARDGLTVRAAGRDWPCRLRAYDMATRQQGMRTDYRAEAWLSDELPWGVVRVRMAIHDLPDERPTMDRYTLRLLAHGDAATLPKPPYFQPAEPADPAGE